MGSSSLKTWAPMTILKNIFFLITAVLIQTSETPQCKRAELLLAQLKPVLTKHPLEHFAKVTFWWRVFLLPGRVCGVMLKLADWGWEPHNLICCYSLFLSTLHADCLTDSAFLISAPPLGCCLNAGHLINLVLSICGIENAAICILAQDLGNVILLAETCPELRAAMSQDLSSVLCAAEIFVCYGMSLSGVSV